MRHIGFCIGYFIEWISPKSVAVKEMVGDVSIEFRARSIGEVLELRDRWNPNR